jgi:hypothetical protein
MSLTHVSFVPIRVAKGVVLPLQFSLRTEPEPFVDVCEFQLFQLLAEVRPVF